MMAAFCASVTSPLQAALSSLSLQSHTVICSWLPQWAAALSACWFSSTPRPTRVRDTNRVMITATCMERLRRRPWPRLDRTYRMKWRNSRFSFSEVVQSAGLVLEAVDALGLVAHDAAVLE